MHQSVEEIINSWAREKTYYQLIIALMGVVMVVGFMAKHFKTIVEVLPSVRKLFSYAHKRWFSQAIFRSDVLKYMNNFQLKLNEIEREVKYNGGSITTVDAIKRLEFGQKIMVDQIIHLMALRNISDRYDSVMRFRYHPEKGFTMINEAFLRGFGHYEAKVLGFNFEDLIHDDDLTEMRIKWNQAANNLTDFRDRERIKDSAGTYHTCELMAQAIKNSDGRLIEFSGVIELSAL